MMDVKEIVQIWYSKPFILVAHGYKFIYCDRHMKWVKVLIPTYMDVLCKLLSLLML
jgi:hypothetical protein